MHDLSIRTDGTRHFFCTQPLLVPIDRLRRVVEDKLRRNRVESFGDRLLRFRHLDLLGLLAPFTPCRSRFGLEPTALVKFPREVETAFRMPVGVGGTASAARGRARTGPPNLSCSTVGRPSR